MNSPFEETLDTRGWCYLGYNDTWHTAATRGEAIALAPRMTVELDVTELLYDGMDVEVRDATGRLVS